MGRNVGVSDVVVAREVSVAIVAPSLLLHKPLPQTMAVTVIPNTTDATMATVPNQKPAPNLGLCCGPFSSSSMGAAMNTTLSPPPPGGTRVASSRGASWTSPLLMIGSAALKSFSSSPFQKLEVSSPSSSCADAIFPPSITGRVSFWKLVGLLPSGEFWKLLPESCLRWLLPRRPLEVLLVEAKAP